MKLRIFFFILTILYSLPGKTFAFQSFNAGDSIDMILNCKNFYEINNTFPIVKKYTFKNDSLFINNLNNIVITSSEKNNIDELFKSHYLLGHFYLQKHDYSNAEEEFLKAKEKAISDQEITLPLYYLAIVKVETDRYIEALEYLRQVKKFALQHDNILAHAMILLQEGYCYTQIEKFDVAENQYKKAFSLIESNSIRELYGEIFMYKGHLQFKQLNYLNALANFYKGLEFFDQDTVINNYAIILEFIGRIYLSQNNYLKASSYFSDAEMLYSKIDDVKSLGAIDFELGLANLGMKKFDLAKTHFDQSIIHYTAINCEKGKAEAYLELANLYNTIAIPDSTIIYLNKINSKAKIPPFSNLEFEYYKQYSLYYLGLNKGDSALIYANKASTIKRENLISEIAFNNLLANVYSFIGKYKQAFYHKTLVTNLKDSLNQKINSYEIKVLQSELELSQTKVIIEHLNEERQIQNKTIVESQALLEKQKLLLYLGLIVLLLVLISAFLLAAFLHQKRKDNKILTAQNIQIAQHREEIELQTQHLQEINKELEELSVIARETDNGIKIMNGAGRILWVNEGYTKMHGYKLEDLQSIENLDLLGEQANINIQQLVNVWYGDKQPITFESLNKTKDQKDIWVQTTLTPILAADGKIDKMIAIDSDITAIKKAENEILIKNQDITSSISYAKRIQEAMTPPFSILTEKFKQSFYFYQPKSIVSGDFYWMTKRHDRLVIACADSTGHGVPGAFMSMIGMSFLNKIVNEKGFVSPDIILNRMRMNIINHLRQEGSESLAGDGMDMSVITIDKRNNKLEYAGAMNPVYVVRNASLIELKPDRMPVGFFDNEDRPFSATTLNLEKEDSIFMFTDGFYDQFGGHDGSKMKSHRFKTIIKKTAQKPFDQQKDFIINEFNSWKGENPQIDDILLMSIKID